MDDVPVEPGVTAVYDQRQILSKKTALCAVNLGVAILQELVGDSISRANLGQDDAELISAALAAELQL